MVMSRYEFLAAAHAIIKPKVYLEVGVQFGPSLALAEAATVAIGIDPLPMVQAHNQRNNQRIYSTVADEFFSDGVASGLLGSRDEAGDLHVVDFAFIDGSHLFEDALRDFLNIEAHLSGPGAVVFFDDVLPYSSAIATREQPLGDWTGDVWKVISILEENRDDLDLTLIDVAPTGLLMVQSDYWPHRSTREAEYRPRDALDFQRDVSEVIENWMTAGEVSPPDDILARDACWGGENVLNVLRERYES